MNLLLEWHKCIDESDGIFGILLKAYDCVNHDLLIINRATYGVGEGRLRLIQIQKT